MLVYMSTNEYTYEISGTTAHDSNLKGLIGRDVYVVWCNLLTITSCTYLKGFTGRKASHANMIFRSSASAQGVHRSGMTQHFVLRNWK